jgi:actin
MSEAAPAAVIDNGSGFMKAGMSGPAEPSCIFPSVIGTPLYKGGDDGADKYIGEQALAKRAVLHLSFPVAHGIVTNWDDMTDIWKHTYSNELRKNPQEQACLLTEAPKNPKKNREKMCEIMLETFSVPKINVQIQAVLALFTAGRTTGCVLDSGDGVSHTVPIYEGTQIPNGVRRLDIAGRDLTTACQSLLQEEGYNFDASAEVIGTVRAIKEQKCYVAQDFAAEMKKYRQKPQEINEEFVLPDLRKIMVGYTRFKTPETLFNPKIIHKAEAEGVHRLIHESIENCGLDARRDLFKNILLSGGSTMFPGFDTRLKLEVSKLTPAPVDITAKPNRNTAVWTGGSILSGLTAWDGWKTKAQIEEEGMEILHDDEYVNSV